MTELNKAALQQLLNKEAQGILNPDEQQRLDNWYSNFDVSQKDLQVFRDTAHEQLVKERLLNRILENDSSAVNTTHRTIKFSRFYQWTSVAAIFLIVMGYGAFQFSKRTVPKNLTAVTRPVMKSLNPSVTRIVLSDGSVVILNKGSHLNYPEKFAGNNREVYLTGEGYFDIKHDAKKPFLVHSGKVITRVLGTAFNIKSGAQVEVTVARGKVAVSDGEKTFAVLLPDQKVSYNTHSHAVIKETANSKIATLWKEEDIVLNNIPLQQAKLILEERYGVQINLATDKIKDCRFTAFFLNTTSLSQVLSVISRLNNLSYTNNNNGTYTLSGEGCELSTVKL